MKVRKQQKHVIQEESNVRGMITASRSRKKKVIATPVHSHLLHVHRGQFVQHQVHYPDKQHVRPKERVARRQETSDTKVHVKEATTPDRLQGFAPAASHAHAVYMNVHIYSYCGKRVGDEKSSSKLQHNSS